MRNYNLLRKLAVPLALGVGLSGLMGCGREIPHVKTGERGGFKTKSLHEGKVYHIVVEDTVRGGSGLYVSGYYYPDKKTFNYIEISRISPTKGIPETGHPIVEYANPGSLKAVNDELRGEQEE